MFFDGLFSPLLCRAEGCPRLGELPGCYFCGHPATLGETIEAERGPRKCD